MRTLPMLSEALLAIPTKLAGARVRLLNDYLTCIELAPSAMRACMKACWQIRVRIWHVVLHRKTTRNASLPGLFRSAEDRRQDRGEKWRSLLRLCVLQT